jgi:hypothetical protein
MASLANHPERFALNYELHARYLEALTIPERAAYLAVVTDPSSLSTARRAKLQLHLQQTVEGLSLAAISYYVVGLIGYLAKALKAAGGQINPDIGIAIPIVALAAAFSIRHIRRAVQRAAA